MTENKAIARINAQPGDGTCYDLLVIPGGRSGGGVLVVSENLGRIWKWTPSELCRLDDPTTYDRTDEVIALILAAARDERARFLPDGEGWPWHAAYKLEAFNVVFTKRADPELADDVAAVWGRQ